MYVSVWDPQELAHLAQGHAQALAEVLHVAGEASAKAQGLHQAITSLPKVRSNGHTIFLAAARYARLGPSTGGLRVAARLCCRLVVLVYCGVVVLSLWRALLSALAAWQASHCSSTESKKHQLRLLFVLRDE